MPTISVPRPFQASRLATLQAGTILSFAHSSVTSLLQNFDALRTGPGAPPHEHQDLLRAMIVFAGAGLDSMTKNLIRRALPVMVEATPEVRERIEDLCRRHIERVGVPEALTRISLADTPRAAVMEMVIDDLTAGSLQSVEEVNRVLRYLGITRGSLGSTDEELRDVFSCRNNIVHDMDVDFNQDWRNRIIRNRATMLKHTRTLLLASNAILKGVDEQLPSDT